MSENPTTPEPAPEPKREKEIDKLGSGQPIDHAKLHEQMDEDHLDKMLEVLRKPDMEDPDNFDD